jgi:hypothetical protein
MSPRTSKALTAWTELNDRQQGTLAAIYRIEEGIEAGRRAGAARGDFDDTPAAIWRQIDFSHEPSNRRVFGTTVLQDQLALHGWHSQGNGSTMAALESRGLITPGSRPTRFGSMRTVRLTREGRAAARAGTSLSTGATKAALSARSWEVLAMLWDAGLAGETLKWGYSTTIERVLVQKHVPPLAERTTDGYAITDRGRDFYREHYAAHTAAHPDVRARHPDGADAEPWPAAADSLLDGHRRHYYALCDAWQNTLKAREAAEKEAVAEPPKTAKSLPAEVAEQISARHRLWQDTARQRADLAAAQVDDFHERATTAGRAYAAASLAAFRAAVARTNPLNDVRPVSENEAWDEERLAPPAETGIHAIDADTKKLHAVAVGAPLRRRGPAPKFRRSRYASRLAVAPPVPGCAFAALADFLFGHIQDGGLTRRLHPAPAGAATR